jgi:hypothetical protein
MTAAMPKSKSWILVAGPRYAQLWSCPANGRIIAIGTLRPQQVFPQEAATNIAASGNLRSFVRQLVQRLEDAARCDDFQRLVIIAPPQMLALLHDHIDRRLGALIQTELAKDLTKGNTVDITAEIKHLLHEPLPVAV